MRVMLCSARRTRAPFTRFALHVCRQVDYQISCDGPEYVAFVTLGAIGVLAVPVGVPALSLVALLKNSREIRDTSRDGGSARKRYDFLVSDYK